MNLRLIITSLVPGYNLNLILKADERLGKVWYTLTI